MNINDIIAVKLAVSFIGGLSLDIVFVFSNFSTRNATKEKFTPLMWPLLESCWNKRSLPGFSLEISFSWKFGEVEAYNTRKVHSSAKPSKKLFSSFVALSANHFLNLLLFWILGWCEPVVSRSYLNLKQASDTRYQQVVKRVCSRLLGAGKSCQNWR